MGSPRGGGSFYLPRDHIHPVHRAWTHASGAPRWTPDGGLTKGWALGRRSMRLLMDPDITKWARHQPTLMALGQLFHAKAVPIQISCPLYQTCSPRSTAVPPNSEQASGSRVMAAVCACVGGKCHCPAGVGLRPAVPTGSCYDDGGLCPLQIELRKPHGEQQRLPGV